MKFGSLLGSLAGSIGSKVLPIPGIDGGALGGFLGGLTGVQEWRGYSIEFTCH
jgi:hypothetical protein